MIYLQVKRDITNDELTKFGLSEFIKSSGIERFEKGDLIELQDTDDYGIVKSFNGWSFPVSWFNVMTEKEFCKQIDKKHLKKD